MQASLYAHAGNLFFMLLVVAVSLKALTASSGLVPTS